MIGQERAKKTLAVAIFNHYNRVKANMSKEYMIEQEQVHTEYHHSSIPEESYFVHPLPTGNTLNIQVIG